MVSNERLNILEKTGSSDIQNLVADIKYLREELKWAYLYIMGEYDDTTEQAGWKAFNGMKRLGG